MFLIPCNESRSWEGCSAGVGTSRNSSVGATCGKGGSGEEGYAACVVGSAWGCYALSPSRVLIPARRPLREWVTAVSHRIAEFSDGPLSVTRPSSPRDLHLPSRLGSPREPLYISLLVTPARAGVPPVTHRELLSRIIWDVECAACKGKREREREKIRIAFS